MVRGDWKAEFRKFDLSNITRFKLFRTEEISYEKIRFKYLKTVFGSFLIFEFKGENRLISKNNGVSNITRL